MDDIHPLIAIIGAGPGGLTLARLLTLRSIPYTIFELRTKFNSSKATGTLDLHAETGQNALRQCGLWAKAEALFQPDGEDKYICDKNGEVLHYNSGHPQLSRPEIDRIDLIKILRESVPEENILWNHKLISISPTSANRWHLEFEGREGENHEFDLVVGADGAWSRIRTALSEVQPLHSKTNCIITHVTDVDNTQPDIAKQIRNGTYWCLGDRKSIIYQRDGHGSLLAYLMVTSPNPSYIYPKRGGSTVDLAKLAPKALLSELISHPDLFASWGESLKAIVTASSLEAEHCKLVPIYMLPIGFSWESRTGITLIGDAAHLMTPFAGEGVNMAMIDAVEIADAIVKASKGIMTLAQAIMNYEKVMFARTKKIAQDSVDAQELFFAETSPNSLVAWMSEMIAKADS